MNPSPETNYSVVFSRALLLFWSSWLSIVFASNLADGLQQAELLPASWRFASGNFSLVRKTVGVYSFSLTWAPILFGAVVFLQLAASLLLWRAFLDRQSVIVPGHPKLLQGFFAAASVFAGFLIADEVFIVYDRLPGLETSHLLALCALLLSLLVISLLGGRGQRA